MRADAVFDAGTDNDVTGDDFFDFGVLVSGCEAAGDGDLELWSKDEEKLKLLPSPVSFLSLLSLLVFRLRGEGERRDVP